MKSADCGANSEWRAGSTIQRIGSSDSLPEVFDLFLSKTHPNRAHCIHKRGEYREKNRVASSPIVSTLSTISTILDGFHVKELPTTMIFSTICHFGTPSPH
jgi:hypothetical protein